MLLLRFWLARRVDPEGMKVLLFPPNYAAINRAFNVRGKPVIFCFGDTVYNPGRIKVPRHLMVHEGVHSRQQGSNPAGWWDRYIVDPSFRLEQEIAAHYAECAVVPNQIDEIAARLASPLYGNMIDFARARAILESARIQVSTASDGNAWPRTTEAAATSIRTAPLPG